MYNRGYSAGEFSGGAPAGGGGDRFDGRCSNDRLDDRGRKETIPKQWRIRCGGLGAEQQVGGPKER